MFDISGRGGFDDKPVDFKCFLDRLDITGRKTKIIGTFGGFLGRHAHIDDVTTLIVNDLNSPVKVSGIVACYDIDACAAGQNAHHVDEGSENIRFGQNAHQPSSAGDRQAADLVLVDKLRGDFDIVFRPHGKRIFYHHIGQGQITQHGRQESPLKIRLGQQTYELALKINDRKVAYGVGLH